jgi:hypothetical protein
MARDNQSNSNSGGGDSDLQRKSAGGRGTPGDYSDPNARQGSGRGGNSSNQSLGGDRNQIANDDDDDDATYGRQAYQGDAGGRSSQGGSEGRSAPSRSYDDEGSGSMKRSAQGGIQSGSQLGNSRQQGGNQGRSGSQGRSSGKGSQRDEE